MRATVLTFQPGDPVPPWFVDVEPRDDVPAHLPRVVRRLEFGARGRIIDDGARYVVEVEPGEAPRQAVTGELYYCHVAVEKPILWADGAYWPGGGVPQPADWTPDPARLQRIAAAERSRAALMSDRLDVQEVREPTYYKAAALFGIGVLIGVAIMAAVVGVVVAVLT